MIIHVENAECYWDTDREYWAVLHSDCDGKTCQHVKCQVDVWYKILEMVMDDMSEWDNIEHHHRICREINDIVLKMFGDQ